MHRHDPSNTRVALLVGGSSNERAISLSSGEQVHKALEKAGYIVEVIDTQDARAAFERLIDGGFDVAFLALHGKGGEDGTIQGACETIGLPYTGSGVLASALAMDKARSKAFYVQNGLSVAPSVTLRHDEPYTIDELVAQVGEQCVVKPIDDGSSLGMSIVHQLDELPAALTKAFANGQDIMIEAYVRGTEITVAVLGNENPEPLPVIEIVPHDEFYSYEVKYAAAGADHIIPARLAPEVYERAQNYAVRAHRALGCSGLSRSDFIVTDDGIPVILETNTLPGMTETSLLPDAARHAGYDFPAVCSRIIELALEKHRA